jgi:hypothetical protein
MGDNKIAAGPSAFGGKNGPAADIVAMTESDPQAILAASKSRSAPVPRVLFLLFRSTGETGSDRREFMTLLGGAAVAWPVAARAQPPDRMRLIGVLMAYAESDSTAQSWLAAFPAALAKLGCTEGSNLRIELRWSAPLMWIG